MTAEQAAETARRHAFSAATMIQLQLEQSPPLDAEVWETIVYDLERATIAARALADSLAAD